MCGIVGGFRFPSKLISPEDQNIIMRIMTVEMLLLTESRGSDATGFVIEYEDGNFRGMKHGKRAEEILANWDGKDSKNFLALMDSWKFNKTPANIVLGHCRKKTTGSEKDNNNNHPFMAGPIIGIHNGAVENHLVIEKKLKEDLKFKFERKGQVDSEMLFHLMNYYMAESKDNIFTADMLKSIVKRLYGSWAVLAFNTYNPYQVAAFRDGKPIEIAISKSAGLVFVASESQFLGTASYRYARIKHYHSNLDYLPLLGLKTYSMNDDSAVIFNLTKEMTEDTKLSDICESILMPRRTERESDWENKTTTTTTKQTTYYNSAGTTTKKSDAHGRVWDAKTGLYITEAEAKEKERKEQAEAIADASDPGDASDASDTVIDGEATEVKTESTKEEIPTDLDDPNAEEVAVQKTSVPVVDLTKYVPPTIVHKSVTVSDEQIVDDKKPSDFENFIKKVVDKIGHFINLYDAQKDAETVGINVMCDTTADMFRIIASRIRKKGVEAGIRATGEKVKELETTVEHLTKVVGKEIEKKKSAEKKIRALKVLVLYLIKVADGLLLDDDFIEAMEKATGYAFDIKDFLSCFSEQEKEKIGVKNEKAHSATVH